MPALFRQNVRYFLIFFFIITFFLAFELTSLILALFGISRGRVRNAFIHSWARLILRILNCRVAVEGPLPQTKYVLVSNHLSYLDIVLFLSFLDVVLISKSEVRNWPLLGYIISRANTIMVDRNDRRSTLRVRGEILENLKSGNGIIFFPEGTSTNGTEVRKFYSALFSAPADEKIPVYACALSYHSPEGWPAANDSVCWWDEITFMAHLYKLCRLPGFQARVRFAGDPIITEDRKEMARLSETKVRELFIPSGTIEA